MATKGIPSRQKSTPGLSLKKIYSDNTFFLSLKGCKNMKHSFALCRPPRHTKRPAPFGAGRLPDVYINTPPSCGKNLRT